MLLLQGFTIVLGLLSYVFRYRNTYTKKDFLRLHYYSLIDVIIREIMNEIRQTEYRTDKRNSAPEALKRFHAEVKELNCLLAYDCGQL